MKNALIIGASSGIGQELAKLLTEDGYKVIITGRRKQLLEEIKEPILKFVVKIHDVNDLDSNDILFESLKK